MNNWFWLATAIAVLSPVVAAYIKNRMEADAQRERDRIANERFEVQTKLIRTQAEVMEGLKTLVLAQSNIASLTGEIERTDQDPKRTAAVIAEAKEASRAIARAVARANVELPEAVATELDREGRLRVWIQHGREQAESLNKRYMPAVARILATIEESAHQASREGLLAFQGIGPDSHLRVSDAVIFPADALPGRYSDEWESWSLTVGDIRFDRDVVWRVQLAVGVLDAGTVGTSHPFRRPRIVVDDQRIGRVVDVAVDERDLEPHAVAQRLPDPSAQAVTQSRVEELQRQYDTGRIQMDEFVAEIVAIGLQRSAVAATLRQKK